MRHTERPTLVPQPRLEIAAEPVRYDPPDPADEPVFEPSATHPDAPTSEATEAAPLSAEPQLRDLAKEATAFVPPSVRRKAQARR